MEEDFFTKSQSWKNVRQIRNQDAAHAQKRVTVPLNPAQPHCVVKFRPVYGDLDWDSTWKTLFFIPLDRKPIDLRWKVAQLFCTMLTALFLSDWMSLSIVSVATLTKLQSICSSTSLGSEWSGLDPVLTRPVLSTGTSYYCTSCSLRFQNRFSSVFELLCVPRVFCYLLSLLKFLVNVMTIVFPPIAVGLIASIEGRLYFYLPLLFKRFRYRRRRLFF